MRIAIVGQGDGRDPSTWSGIPKHLGDALARHGADVVHLDANPPRPVTRAAVTALRGAGVRQPGASHGPELARLRTLWVAWRLRRLAVDAVVQANTGVCLPAGTRYLTYQDLTVAQALGVGWSDPALMSARRARAWLARERRICRGAVACCAASDWTAASIVADYGVPQERVITTGFGINAPTRPGERSWQEPHFLFVGREWERKNGPLVVAAFRRLRRRFPAATLTLVGQHPRIDEPGVHDAGMLQASSPADRATLVALFERATCLVVPSEMEPFGIVYLEAGAAGIPSIGTCVGGAATAVGDGGILVEPGNEGELVAAMERLADPGAARELGGRAAAHATRFTWERIAGTMLAALTSGSRPSG